MNLIYPWFLFGLAAIAIPITIHLLQLRRPQRLLFSNTSFIREVELVSVRHRKVQHLMLLLARVLGLSALVLAFCQPFIPNKDDSASVGFSGADVFVDNSMSMEMMAVNQESLFENARTQARNLAVQSSTTSRFKLLNSGNSLVTRAVFLGKLDGLSHDTH